MRGVFHRAKLGAVPLLLLLMSACASGVSRDPAVSQTQMTFGESQRAGGVSIALTPEAEKIASTTIRFDQEILLRQIRRGLEQKSAMSASADQTLPNIEVLITSIRSRSAFNAVMWGFMAGDDHIHGTVVVRSPEGAELQRFNVTASYALGGFAGGQTDARMGWLYETFAKHVVDELTGTAQAAPAEKTTSDTGTPVS